MGLDMLGLTDTTIPFNFGNKVRDIKHANKTWSIGIGSPK